MKSNSQNISNYKIKLLAIIASLIILLFIIIVNISSNNRQVPISKVGKEDTKAAIPTTILPDGYDPIYDATDLMNINQDLTKKYILMADIDLSGVNFVNIARYNDDFTGEFDGNYHTISNMKIQSTNEYYTRIGLFGRTNGATIKNLTLENATIECDNHIVYSIVAGSAKNSTFQNVRVTGNSKMNIVTKDVSSYQGVGVIIGQRI